MITQSTVSITKESREVLTIELKRVSANNAVVATENVVLDISLQIRFCIYVNDFSHTDVSARKHMDNAQTSVSPAVINAIHAEPQIGFELETSKVELQILAYLTFEDAMSKFRFRSEVLTVHREPKVN